MVTDRHGRAHRADNDPRRRPTDGFRITGATRFRSIVGDAIASLPDRLREPLRGAQLHVVDVPDEPALTPEGELVLATFADGVLTVFRRPVETRADSRAVLEETLLVAIGQAVGRTEGFGDDIGDLFG
jgi:hypothetical protein